jgi:2,4-dichlorophenol 6-monooxygenase
MNQLYQSMAVLEDVTMTPAPRDTQLYCHVTTRPGVKIPQAWLANRNHDRVSTLDLVGRGQFTLVTGLTGTFCAAAATSLNAAYLRTLVIGSPHAQDVYCSWQNIREIEESGALLIRPDRVVAWRRKSAAATAADAVEALAAALQSIMGHERHSISRLQAV